MFHWSSELYFIFKNWQWHPTPVLLPGKCHGRRSLVGCSPWGRKESGRTERLYFPFSLSCIREGNGNPLQCSCLGNPRDGGAWWAAVYRVAQGWTRLQWLSSSCWFNYHLSSNMSFLSDCFKNVFFLLFCLEFCSITLIVLGWIFYFSCLCFIAISWIWLLSCMLF